MHISFSFWKTNLALWTGLFLFAQASAQSGLDSLPTDPRAFSGVLKTMLEGQKAEQLASSLQPFDQLIVTAGITAQEFELVRQTTDALLQKKLVHSVALLPYLSIVSKLKSASAPSTAFAEWHQVFQAFLSPNPTFSNNDAIRFLNVSLAFIQDSYLRFAGENAVNWKIKGGSWKFRLLETKPVVSMQDATLIAYSSFDSLQIFSASGEFYPLEERWQGKTGRSTWERAGLPAEVQATFTNYLIELNKPIVTIGSAQFVYPAFFGARKISGTFTDKVSVAKVISSNYPAFESLSTQVEVKNLGEGVRYAGGFRLEGKTFIGLGSEENKSVLQVYNQKGKLVFKGMATRFAVQEGKQITGQKVIAHIYTGSDSIYHPSVNLRFLLPNKTIELYRGESGSERNPFFSSANQVQINTENMLILVEKDSVLIGQKAIAIQRKAPVTFESIHFFNRAEFDAIQGIGSYNPLTQIGAIARASGLQKMPATDLAKAMGTTLTAETLERLLFNLSEKGYLDYIPTLGMVFFKDKLFNTVNAASGKSDYDALRLTSTTDDVNARLHLSTQKLLIDGVPLIVFSKPQNVVAVPDSNQVTMGTQLQMDFGGLLQAGYAELQSPSFHFDYVNFRISADSIARLRLFAPEQKPKETPGQEPFALASDIERFGGILLIDGENNKNGKENIPLFPSINSKTNSFVFYDNPFVQDTSYKRDSFYFELEPFNLHELDNYTKNDLKFKGWLVSARIFQPFRETLRVQSDYSLGFLHKTPDEGYPIYQHRGKFTGSLTLSNQGFTGNGMLDYLGAKISAKDYLLRPNQLSGSARDLLVPESRDGRETPQVSGKDVQINWLPYADSMYISSASSAFTFFKEKAHTLRGTLILTPSGLNSNGMFEWDDALINSRLMSFGTHSLQADTMDVAIKAPDTSSIVIQTKNVSGRVDFDAQSATFKANDGQLQTALPFNQYETSMNSFSWDMKNQRIVFEADSTLPGTFSSLHPDMDSLAFQGKQAAYDLQSNQLLIQGVPLIQSADAYIYPDSGRVEIAAGGAMATLENAVIVCDTNSRKHIINRATVQVLGKKEYRASGFYEYPVGDKLQEIEFSSIEGTRVGKGLRSQKPTATIATGEILDSDSFLIDTKTTFYGQIGLGSESENLRFSGFAKLKSEALPERNWFSIQMNADKKNLAIPIKNPKNEEGFPLENGLFLSKEMSFIYPRLMMPLYFRKDRPIFPIRGVLRYDRVRDQFILGDSSKVLRDDLSGNKMVFHSKSGKVEAEGKFSIGSALKYYKIKAAGTASGQFRNLPDSLLADTPPPGVDFDLLAGIQFPFPEKLIRIIQNEIASSSFTGSPIPYLSDVLYYKKGLSELFEGAPAALQAIQEMTNGILAIPERENTFTFLLSGMKMRWDMDYQSMVTSKPDAGLISVFGKPVNQMVVCHSEFKMPSNDDDRAYIHLQLPNQIYYYFGYRNGILELNSNDNRFMDEASKMKSSELNLKMPDGKSYEIQLVEASRAQMFLRRAQASGK